MNPPHDFLVVGEGIYRVEVPDRGIVLHVDRLHRDRGDLSGELTVTCNLAGARRLTDEDIISAGTFNLSSIRARQDRASYLAKRSQLPSDQFDWYGAIEYLCIRVIGAERTGQPAVLLRDVPIPAPDDTWLWHGLPILRHESQVWFADGDTGKSLLALAAAGEMAREGRNVLYADWETSAGPHKKRLARLFSEPLPPVQYVRCEWPLVHEVDRLRRLRLAHDVDFMILDSAGYGCEGPPEAAEAATAYFRAVRQLGVGTLILAHRTKADTGDQRPFGSAFWHNSPRMTWFLQRSEPDGDRTTMTVGCFNRKFNDGARLAARGLRVRFADTAITITSSDLVEHDDFAGRLPLWQRCVGALRAGPLTLPELAEATGAKLDSIIKTVKRSEGKTFTRLPGTDGKPRVYLVERQTA